MSIVDCVAVVDVYMLAMICNSLIVFPNNRLRLVEIKKLGFA